MASLSTKIELFLGREVDFLKDVVVEDIGKGTYIKEWNLKDTKPTDEQLNALNAEAEKTERNKEVIHKRKLEYGSWQNQLDEIYENGIDSWKTRIAKVKTDNPKE